MSNTKRNPYEQVMGQGVPTPKNTRVASKGEEQIYDASGNYNPQAFGGTNSLGQALPSAKNRLFDKKGELNAQSNQDALVQIAHLLKNVAPTQASRSAFSARTASNGMTPEARREVLAAAMDDPEGFRVIGQELLLPIKDIVDYEAWGRKAFRVRPLAQGELFRIAKDVRATAWLIAQDGQSIESRLSGKYVQPSEFKIGAFPTVDIEDIYQMNYDVLDRAQDTARQEIELEEDKRAQALLDTAARSVNPVTTFGTLGMAALEDVRYQIERHRLVCEKFLINRQELSDIIKTMSSQVDPVTERELILAGYIGSVLNCQIITAAGTGVEEVVPAGTFYAVTGPEYMGEMGIRIELFSEPFNEYAQRRTVKGWAFMEMIGYAVVNPRAVAVGEK